MKIDIVRTECGSGDCELGCYNTGYGGYIVIDGVKVFEKEAWATCCDNSEMSYTELLQEEWEILIFCNPDMLNQFRLLF